MKKVGIILAVLVVFALVSTVSAFGPITFSYNGNLVVTYVSLMQVTTMNSELKNLDR